MLKVFLLALVRKNNESEKTTLEIISEFFLFSNAESIHQEVTKRTVVTFAREMLKLNSSIKISSSAHIEGTSTIVYHIDSPKVW